MNLIRINVVFPPFLNRTLPLSRQFARISPSLPPHSFLFFNARVPSPNFKIGLTRSKKTIYVMYHCTLKPYIFWPLQRKTIPAVVTIINNAKHGKRIFKTRPATLLLSALAGNVIFTSVSSPNVAPSDALCSFTRISIFWSVTGMKTNRR